MKNILIVFLLVFFSQQQHKVPLNMMWYLTQLLFQVYPDCILYAFGQHNGKWLIIGGRKDGVHARQPFNAFPGAQNNTDMYVDVATQQTWSASVNSLPTGIKEQLQSTNMNFYQDGDALFIIGGYAYSTTAADHKTFNNLTSIDVPNLINAIISRNSYYFLFQTNIK